MFFPRCWEFRITPLSGRQLGRDQDPGNLSRADYQFDGVPHSYSADYPMVCPRVALFKLLNQETREAMNRKSDANPAMF